MERDLWCVVYKELLLEIILEVVFFNKDRIFNEENYVFLYKVDLLNGVMGIF